MNYNRKFIFEFSRKVLSLTRLTRKNVQWKWEKKEQKTFEFFKNACLTNSILRISNIKKSFCIDTNAFDLIIRAFLSQQDDKEKWHSYYEFAKTLSRVRQGATHDCVRLIDRDRRNLGNRSTSINRQNR